MHACRAFISFENCHFTAVPKSFSIFYKYFHVMYFVSEEEISWVFDDN